MIKDKESSCEFEIRESDSVFHNTSHNDYESDQLAGNRPLCLNTFSHKSVCYESKFLTTSGSGQAQMVLDPIHTFSVPL